MKRIILVAIAAASLLVPAVQAAKPAKDSSFQYCPKKNNCPFGFNTDAKGKKITDIKLYTKCNAVPASWPKIKVNRKGKFAKTGTAKNVIDEQVSFTIKGKFKTKKKAVGTYEVDGKGCSDSPVKFVAKRVGDAQPGF